MGHGRPEQREDAVARRLRNVTAVAMHRRHHNLQHRIDDRARLLGIEIAHQLRRTLDVGEQRRDRLALAVDCLRFRIIDGYTNARGSWACWPRRLPGFPT
jgi:hypothetical protein